MDVSCDADRRGFRAPYCCCQLVGICGGALYGLAAKWHSLPVALAGRALLGTAAASNSLAGAYIARTAPQSKVAGLALYGCSTRCRHMCMHITCACACTYAHHPVLHSHGGRLCAYGRR